MFPLLGQFLINCKHASICGMNEATESDVIFFLILEFLF